MFLRSHETSENNYKAFFVFQFSERLKELAKQSQLDLLYLTVAESSI